jgi:hypothetical protein
MRNFGNPGSSRTLWSENMQASMSRMDEEGGRRVSSFLDSGEDTASVSERVSTLVLTED